MPTQRLAFAIALPIVLLLLATPYVYDTAATATQKPVRQYWASVLVGGSGYRTSLFSPRSREQTVVGGLAVWRTIYVAGPEPAWGLIGVLALLLAVSGWFAGTARLERRPEGGTP